MLPGARVLRGVYVRALLCAWGALILGLGGDSAPTMGMVPCYLQKPAPKFLVVTAPRDRPSNPISCHECGNTRAPATLTRVCPPTRLLAPLASNMDHMDPSPEDLLQTSLSGLATRPAKNDNVMLDELSSSESYKGYSVGYHHLHSAGSPPFALRSF